MNTFKKFLTATFISSVMFCVATAQAIPIQQFEKMGDLRGPYIADLLRASKQSLKNAGRLDDIKQIENLFTTKAPDGKASIGVEQFFAALAVMFKNEENKPNPKPIEVSKVWSVFLDKMDHIKLPEEFKELARKLDQKYPPPK